jgi:SAM-dependent methyltransferase
MMPQYDDAGGYAPCKWVLSMGEPQSLVKNGVLSYVHSNGGLLHFQLNTTPENLQLEFPHTLRYLDRFWLLLPSSPQEQYVFWKRFYTLYSAEYLHMINIENNISCLRYFDTLLKKENLLPPHFKLLDFGCGPGTSIEVFGSEHIVGYDTNPEMLAQAKARGMTIIEKADFENASRCCYDGSIACYVFHMAIPESDIVRLAKCVKVGGTLVANYYKDLGAERVTSVLQEIGFSAQKADEFERRFGSVYIYRRK